MTACFPSPKGKRAVIDRPYNRGYFPFTMAEHDFKLDTRFSDRPRTYVRPLATAVAIAGIVLIILTMTTGISARLLPMEDKYLIALIPQAPDGAEPLSLKTLQHQANETTAMVS